MAYSNQNRDIESAKIISPYDTYFSLCFPTNFIIIVIIYGTVFSLKREKRFCIKGIKGVME